MQVKDLIGFLMKCNPESEVMLHISKTLFDPSEDYVPDPKYQFEYLAMGMTADEDTVLIIEQIDQVPK